MSPVRPIINLYSCCFLMRSETDSLNSWQILQVMPISFYSIVYYVLPSAVPDEKWGQRLKILRVKRMKTMRKWLKFWWHCDFPAYLNLHCTNVKLSTQKHDCRPINVLGSVVRHHSQAKDARVNAYSSYLPTDSRSQWINRPTLMTQLHKVKHCYSLNFRSSTNKRLASLIFIKITFMVEIYAQSRANMGAGRRIIDKGLFRLTLC